MNKADDYGDLKWQLFHLSQALTRAKRMEKYRADFFEELYESIVYPSVNLDYNNPVMHSAKVDIQAIRIIQLKERYDKKIQQEYEKHLRWKDLLAWAIETDEHLLIRYFQKRDYLEPTIVMRLLRRLEVRIHDEEFTLEKERDDLAKETYKIHRKDFHDKYAVKIPLDHVDKQQYLINGQFVYMTPEEYAEDKVNRKAASDERMKNFMADIKRRRAEAT
ncbi:hypothetical protein H9649_12035 [Sporosarcina sp. Sa2YVA2]|uniref:Uncharacterized protein n=1 Tax=Sporosarcina quadrami TaxID=2762234 RepID=A0ABR8UCP6_9BACL|nr:hypothetical protein [Sporosarcina quadrami]MBD7985319.1 hypothetical protein [Sporosarcina quadrami]